MYHKGIGFGDMMATKAMVLCSLHKASRRFSLKDVPIKPIVNIGVESKSKQGRPRCEGPPSSVGRKQKEDQQGCGLIRGKVVLILCFTVKAWNLICLAFVPCPSLF